jgi:Pentapeptide repeats (8 copies)
VKKQLLHIHSWRCPFFFDSARVADPADLLHVSTKRQFLNLEFKRERKLAKRRHPYYATLEDLNSFVEALNTLPAVKKNDTELDRTVALIEKELTGDWMYLFELDEKETELINRLEQLHQWLVADGWQYSDTYALSNVVSLLALLGRFRVTDKAYLHCNLRNAQIINSPQIVRSQFHGVDFGGARIHGAKITDGKFIGADFTGACFENTVLEGKSRFVGCRFDKNTFKSVTRGPEVLFVESLPDDWAP